MENPRSVQATGTVLETLPLQVCGPWLVGQVPSKEKSALSGLKYLVWPSRAMVSVTSPVESLRSSRITSLPFSVRNVPTSSITHFSPSCTVASGLIVAEFPRRRKTNARHLPAGPASVKISFAPVGRLHPSSATW